MTARKAISHQDAIRLARQQFGLAFDVPASAVRVRSLDRQDGSYYLVSFGSDQAIFAVATVNEVGGDVGTMVTLPGTGPHLAVDAADAVGAAGGAPNSPVELVWTPCAASLSPLYPLWAVTIGQRTVYVDGGGRVWDELGPPRPGGAWAAE